MKQLTHHKSYLFMVIIAMCILGCKETTEQAVVEESPAVTELTDTGFTALWKKVDALWEQGDAALISTVYADNFIRISPGGTSTSVEELTSELNAVGVAFPDLKLNLERYDVRSNMVMVHWSVEGTFTGEQGGIKGNGKPYKVVGVSIITVEDNKIVKDDSYWDTFAVFRQTGYAIVEGEVETN